MVEIKPFEAIIYSQEKVKTCIAPPYDEITHKEQEELYKKERHNIVRIVRGKENPTDDEKNNKYTRAKQYFQKWYKEKILIKEKPALYLLEQEYCLNNKNKKRQGIISLLKLEEKNKDILPHESTRPAPLLDQFQMLKTTKSHFSPIFFLYKDKNKEVSEILKKSSKKLMFNFTVDGVSHKLYQIYKEDEIKDIAEKMKDKKIIIADGHHRFKASIKYQQEYKHNFTLAYLTDIDSKNLDILSFHRYIHTNNLMIDAMFKKLSEYFYIKKTNLNLKNNHEINEMINKLNTMNREEKTFGMYFYRKFYFIQLKDKKILNKIMPEKSPSLRNLSTSILHKLVLENIFGEEIENISYIQDATFIIKDINKNKEGVAFFVPYPSPLEVQSIAYTRESMPPKSTYFYPKIYSGLVIYSWDENI